MKRTPSDTKPMFRTHNNLPEGTRKEVIALCSQALADGLDLQLQLKQAHWNVKGPNFIGLHELFDKVAADVTAYADEVAERIMQLGGSVQGTVRVTAARSGLKEYPLGITDGAAHVQAVSEALTAFGATVRAAIDKAADLGDADTADIFTEISRGVDKWLWFVEAHGQASR